MSTENNAQEQNQGMAAELPLQIVSQYIRDVSFENPGAPDSLDFSKTGQPDMDVNIGLDARKLPEGDNMYEVALSARAQAIAGGQALFIVEIQYGLVVQVDAQRVPEDQIHPMLFIEVPRHAFPFVRQIVANLVAQGGFPPLFLTPIDFQKLYIDRFADDLKQQQDAKAAASSEDEKQTVN